MLHQLLDGTVAITDTYFKPNQVPKADEKLSDFDKVDTRIPNQTTEAQKVTLNKLTYSSDCNYIKGEGASLESILNADTVVVVMDLPGLNDNMLTLSAAINKRKNIILILPDGSIDKTEQEKYELKHSKTNGI